MGDPSVLDRCGELRASLEISSTVDTGASAPPRGRGLRTPAPIGESRGSDRAAMATMGTHKQP